MLRNIQRYTQKIIAGNTLLNIKKPFTKQARTFLNHNNLVAYSKYSAIRSSVPYHASISNQKIRNFSSNDQKDSNEPENPKKNNKETKSTNEEDQQQQEQQSILDQIKNFFNNSNNNNNSNKNSYQNNKNPGSNWYDDQNYQLLLA